MRFEGPTDTLGSEEPQQSAVGEVEDAFGDEMATTAADPKLTLPPLCVCTGGKASVSCGTCFVRAQKKRTLARQADVSPEAIRDLLVEDFGHCTSCNELKPIRGSFPTGEEQTSNGMRHITCADCSLDFRG